MPPNILLITADQMRWDCLGAAGNPHIQTPHLDALAARGVLFRNAFTPDPICVPARASIMTGNYPMACTGSKSNSGRIREGQPLLTTALRSTGYHAYACGKLHFVPYSPPGEPRLLHGFEQVDLMESGRILNKFDPEGKLQGLEDYFDYLKAVGWGGYARAHGIGNNDVRPCPSPLPAEHYVDRWIADCVERRINEHARRYPEQPFFMWMSSPKPHAPYDPPRPYDQLYDPRDLPKPFGSKELIADRHAYLDSTRFTHAIPSLSPEAWQVIRSYYYGNITFLDAMIGRVLDYLKECGRLDSTLVLFTADHGDLLGDFGSCFKSNHLNGSVRVPFLAAGPGVAEGAVCDAPVGLQDVFPTLAAQAGTEPGQPVHGMDLSPLLEQPGQSGRDHYYATTGAPGAQCAMLFSGQWKYIYSEQGGIEELYDQENDPRELENLAASTQQRDRLRELREQLIEKARGYGDHDLIPEGKLAHTALDRGAFASLPANQLGQRWY